MPELHLPWLELSILIPLLGAICGRLASTDRERAPTTIALAICALTLCLQLGEWLDFDIAAYVRGSRSLGRRSSLSFTKTSS